MPGPAYRRTVIVEVSIEIAADPETVWSDISDVASHAEWMADAEKIEFESDQRTGPGTAIVVLTRVGPFRTSDRMRFTSWEPPKRMAVEHVGLFTGSGEFILDPVDPNTTRFTWREEVRFAWYLGGPVAALFARPILRLIWRRNLTRLRDRLSGP